MNNTKKKLKLKLAEHFITSQTNSNYNKRSDKYEI